MFEINENIIVLKTGATNENLEAAISKFDKYNYFNDEIGTMYDGEMSVDIFSLTEEQKNELREYYGYSAVFSDKSGEPGDIGVYFTGRLELTKENHLTLTGFSFLTADLNSAYSDEDPEFEWGVIHPTNEQILDFFIEGMRIAS